MNSAPSSPDDDESPTLWVVRLRQGDGDAAQKLWQQYFQQLVHLARRRLQNTARRVADEEDVALSAFHSFFRGIERGRFPQIDDRYDLWKLLMTITLNKISHLRRDAGRAKRGGGWKSVPLDEIETLKSLVGKEPTPELAAELVDQLEQLLGELQDTTLQQIAVCKMEGFTNAEIAQQLQVAERTIERKLKIVRQIWTRPDDEASSAESP